MQDHKDIHNTENIWHCDVCPQTFAKRSSLKYHLRHHHDHYQTTTLNESTTLNGSPNVNKMISDDDMD